MPFNVKVLLSVVSFAVKLGVSILAVQVKVFEVKSSQLQVLAAILSKVFTPEYKLFVANLG